MSEAEIEQNSIMIVLLKEIIEILRSMKQQEKDYWETWKKAKTKERPTLDD